MTSILCLLNIWRQEQYHFAWNYSPNSAPALLWVEFDVSWPDYMNLMNVPPIVNCAFQTCPYFKIEKFDARSRHHWEHLPPQNVETEQQTVTPIQRIVPVRRQLVVEQIPEVKFLAVETAQVLNHAFCLVPLSLSTMSVEGNPNGGELYTSFQWLSMDLVIDPRAKQEIPSPQDLVRCTEMHPDTHMTMGYFNPSRRRHFARR